MARRMKGTLPCELFGGPLDGKKYGDLPDPGEPLTGAVLSIPLGQPAADHPTAVYDCVGQASTGFWQLAYRHTELPETPVGTQPACPAPQKTTSAPAPKEIDR